MASREGLPGVRVLRMGNMQNVCTRPVWLMLTEFGAVRI